MYKLGEITADVMISNYGTLHRHEVGKVPDEFADQILLPLLVEYVVAALQDHLLVLLSKHHGWILERKRDISKH